jgi:hypothetical protein
LERFGTAIVNQRDMSGKPESLPLILFPFANRTFAPALAR